MLCQRQSLPLPLPRKTSQTSQNIAQRYISRISNFVPGRMGSGAIFRCLLWCGSVFSTFSSLAPPPLKRSAFSPPSFPVSWDPMFRSPFRILIPLTSFHFVTEAVSDALPRARFNPQIPILSVNQLQSISRFKPPVMLSSIDMPPSGLRYLSMYDNEQKFDPKPHVLNKSLVSRSPSSAGGEYYSAINSESQVVTFVKRYTQSSKIDDRVRDDIIVEARHAARGLQGCCHIVPSTFRFSSLRLNRVDVRFPDLQKRSFVCSFILRFRGCRRRYAHRSSHAQILLVFCKPQIWKEQSYLIQCYGFLRSISSANSTYCTSTNANLTFRLRRTRCLCFLLGLICLSSTTQIATMPSQWVLLHSKRVAL